MVSYVGQGKLLYLHSTSFDIIKKHKEVCINPRKFIVQSNILKEN